MSLKRPGRGRLRLLASLLIAALLLLPCSAYADGAQETLDDTIEELFERYRLTEKNFAIGFRALSDGTEYWYNADKLFETASLYKLPLNMYFYELEAAGELEPDGAVYGIPLDLFHEQSLEHSNNELSQAMLDWIGSYREFKDIAFGYTGLDDSLRDAEYYACGGFSARMMVGMLQTLWDDPDTFGEAIEHLKKAHPGEYLESGECGLEIAQKYGYEHYDGIVIAGIVYTDEPFLITVLTRGVGWAEVLMGGLCDAFAEYEQTRERWEPVPPETGAEGPSVQPVSALLDAARLALRLAGFPFAAGLI